jgi:hypothetical protein
VFPIRGSCGLTEAAGFRKRAGKQASPQRAPQDTDSKNGADSAVQGTPLCLLTLHMQIAVPLDGAALSNVTAVLLSDRGSGAPSGRLAHGTRAPRHRLSLIDPSHQAASSGRSEKYSAFVARGVPEKKGVGKLEGSSVYWRHPLDNRVLEETHWTT